MRFPNCDVLKMVKKYLLWKNGLLITILLLGIVYALPNIVSEQPIVQVSPPTDSQESFSELTERVKQILQQAKIDPIASKVNYQSLLLRFRDTDTQLKAKDRLSVALGDEYTVAVNFMSALPSWLHNIGAVPMTLGLDLRGGVHFSLELDVDGLLAQRLEGLVHNLSGYLRQEKIRYLTVGKQSSKRLSIIFQTSEQLSAANRLLGRQFPHLKFSPQQMNHRYQLQVEWTHAAVKVIQQRAVEQTMETLGKRINALGIAEPVIQRQGGNRILVDLPGIKDIGRAQQILGGTATVEFHLVDTHHDPRTVQAAVIPPDLRLYTYQGRLVLLNKQVALAGTSITNASLNFDEAGRVVVDINLGGGGESYFYRVTRENIGRPLATVYVETKQITRKVKGKLLKIPHQVERTINIATINSLYRPIFKFKG